MGIKFNKSPEESGFNISIKVGILPFLIVLGVLAKCFGWIDWNWLTIVLVAIGGWLFFSLLMLIVALAMMSNVKRTFGIDRKEMKQVFNEQKELSKKLKESMTREEEYDRKISAEPKNPVAPPYARSTERESLDFGQDLNRFADLDANTECFVLIGNHRLMNKDITALYTHTNGNRYMVVSKDKYALERFAQAKANSFIDYTSVATKKDIFVNVNRTLMASSCSGLLYIEGNKASFVYKHELAHII